MPLLTKEEKQLLDRICLYTVGSYSLNASEITMQQMRLYYKQQLFGEELNKVEDKLKQGASIRCDPPGGKMTSNLVQIKIMPIYHRLSFQFGSHICVNIELHKLQKLLAQYDLECLLSRSRIIAPSGQDYIYLRFYNKIDFEEAIQKLAYYGLAAYCEFLNERRRLKITAEGENPIRRFCEKVHNPEIIPIHERQRMMESNDFEINKLIKIAQDALIHNKTSDLVIKLAGKIQENALYCDLSEQDAQELFQLLKSVDCEDPNCAECRYYAFSLLMSRSQTSDDLCLKFEMAYYAVTKIDPSTVDKLFAQLVGEPPFGELQITNIRSIPWSCLPSIIEYAQKKNREIEALKQQIDRQVTTNKAQETSSGPGMFM